MNTTAQLTNSQNELMTIVEITAGPFTGQSVLRIHDDPSVSNTVAIHLLDKETIAFLLEELPKL